MQVDTNLLEMEADLTNVNSVKEVVLSRLLTDEIITSEQAQEYSEKWNVIIIKPSWFKRWKNKFKPNSDDSYMYKYVRFED
ncbi:MAG: hypothetical protein M0R17_10385 [Candidatus Omnitrophica bacterium]|jgi:hypothetical protein|nr:hypothetical protein [Candidatus Omnitrophota bacterium]